jgi:hypothetical protein
MKRTLVVFLLVNLMLSACAPVSAPTIAPAPSATPLPTATATPTLTPTSTPQPTSTPEPTAEPTATETPIPTALPTYDEKVVGIAGVARIESKREWQAIADSAISQYEKTLNLQPGSVKLDVKGYKDKDDNQYALALTQDGKPLMIWEKGEWRKLTIDKAFEKKGKEVQVRGEPGGGPQISALTDFGGISVTTTLEGTMSYIERNGWKVPDAFVGMTNHAVLGQIAWGYRPILPQSVLDLPPQKLQEFAISQIHDVLGHFFQKYPNKRYDLIIAGESTYPTLYHDKLGDPNNYLIEQYTAANNDITAAGRKRATNGDNNGDKLGYSDFISGVDDPNLENIIRITKTLKAKGLLDVLYLQLRYVGSPNLDPERPPSRQQLAALSEKIFKESGGVYVVFSEVGIQGKGDPKTIFGNTVGGCADSPACLGVQFYAVGQAEDGQNQYPIFDTVNGKDVPNHLYYEVMKAILNP